MGVRHIESRLVIGLTLAIVMLMGLPAASAFASAKVRLVNARSGSQAIGLKVVVGTAAPPEIGTADYGQVTPYVNVAPGGASISITGLSGSAEREGVQTTQDLVDGKRYTAVALAKGSKGFQIKVYSDGDAKKKTARLRVIHAAPELGAPDIKLGQRTIAEKVAYTDASPYLSVAPGSYTLAVVKPGGGSPVFQQHISLSAGAATTAIIAGSGGAKERLIMASDQTVTPAGAPETGLGGLADGDGPPWLLIALAALFAGTLGGVIQLSLARRR
jgi:hypothetical protein